MAAIGGTTGSAISFPAIRGPLLSLSRRVSHSIIPSRAAGQRLSSSAPKAEKGVIPSSLCPCRTSTTIAGRWAPRVVNHYQASAGGRADGGLVSKCRIGGKTARHVAAGETAWFVRSVGDMSSAATVGVSMPVPSSAPFSPRRECEILIRSGGGGRISQRKGSTTGSIREFRRSHSQSSRALAEGGGEANGTQEGEVSGGEGAGQTYMVTTPLYYVNAAPHMGSAYPTIAADALARFQRLRGKKVIFVTGTDEHGEKIAASAASNNREPKVHVDLIAEDYRALWKELDISYDRFIRTTDPRHKKIVEEFFQRVWAKGDIYRADYEGLYCVNCEEYKDEKELLEDNCCTIHRKPCLLRREDNYFFKLSNYQDALEKLYEENVDFVRPSFRKNEVLTWVKEGVKDFSISRAAVDWGIPVPVDPKQTIYVWFDALLGYVSSLLEGNDEAALELAVRQGWPAQVHIIGKDILRFHAVYWPAMLLSAGFPLPKAVFGHGFLTKDGLKMGKSLGNTLEPMYLVGKYGADAVRYYFLKEIEFGKDGDFSEKRFVEIVNANLANNIGNLLSRTLGLLRKNCGGKIPVDSAIVSEGHIVKAQAAESVGVATKGYEELSFGAVGEAIIALATACNHYLDGQAPWSQFKKGPDEANQAAMDLVIVLEASRILAVLLHPMAPALSQRIFLQLGFSEADWIRLSWADTAWGALTEGHPVAAEPFSIFARLDDPKQSDTITTEQPGASKKKKKGGQDTPKTKTPVASVAGGQS